MLLFIAFLGNAQIKKERATLFFKNGDTLNCYARISGNYIRYADIGNTSREIKVNYDKLDRIDLRYNDNLISFYYKLEEGKKTHRLMEKIVEGKINLYKISNVYNKKPNFNSKKTSSTKYFLESKNGNTVFRIKKDFNKIAKAYFKDCKELVNLIGKDGYRKKDLLDIVLYYNENS